MMVKMVHIEDKEDDVSQLFAVLDPNKKGYIEVGTSIRSQRRNFLFLI